jgi:hypothetical protein
VYLTLYSIKTTIKTTYYLERDILLQVSFHCVSAHATVSGEHDEQSSRLVSKYTFFIYKKTLGALPSPHKTIECHIPSKNVGPDRTELFNKFDAVSNNLDITIAVASDKL